MAQRRALIIGGSMSGLLAALMLRRRGWEVDIYERVAGELAGRGAGIVAQPTLIAHLNKLGLDTGELGVPIARRQMLDREGRVTLTGRCPQILTAWERVYRLLRDAFLSAHYHRGRELASFEQMARGVVARFADGRGRRADRSRWAALDRAAALSACDCAALCRLRRLARHGAGGRAAACAPS